MNSITTHNLDSLTNPSKNESPGSIWFDQPSPVRISTDTNGIEFTIPNDYSEDQKTDTIKPPVSALDVAEYILRKCGRMSTMKLQKLVYYCQAWSLVWDEQPLFIEQIEAWANGPVIRELFNYHRGMFSIDKVYTGNPDLLTEIQKETIDAVLSVYGQKSAQWLIELSHSEEPWQKARRGIAENDRGCRVISLSDLAEYYSSIY